MAPNIKVSKALSAMREIGIAEETVKPVLKNLLKLYDKKWELIEEENYRALADAIFEYEENKEEEGRQSEDLNEDSQPPLKRPRLKQQDQVSPSSVRYSGSLSGQNSLRKPKLEENPIETSPIRPSQLFPRDKTTEHEAVSPEMHLRDKRKECTSPLNHTRPERSQPSQREMVLSPQSFPRQQRAEQLYPCPGDSRTKSVDPVSPQTHFRHKGKEPISPQFSSREKRPVSKGSSGICFKEPRVEPGIVLSHREKFPSSHHVNALIKPKVEPLTDDFPQLEVPIAVIHPLDSGPRRSGDSVRKDFNSVGTDSTSKKDGEETMVSEKANRKYDGNGGSYSSSKSGKSLELANTSEYSGFEIASSPLGEVKVSLSCNSILGRSNFHMPSLDTVLKMVEDRCLRSYKIEPRFSLMKLMKELCQCVLDAGSDSVDKNGEKARTVTPSMNSLKKSCKQNGLGSKGSSQGNFNIPANFCSSSKVVVPKIPRLRPMDGLVELHRFIQPNQKIIGKNVCEKIKNNGLTSSQCSSSRSLVVYQPTRSILDDTRPLHDVNDLSKGEERVRISLVNDISSEPYPPLFYYIPQNIVYQDAYINFSLARIGDEDCCSKCFGDCMSSPIPCACARETGGEFAYSSEGLVNRKFLDECISMIRDSQNNRLFYCQDCPLERPKPCKGHLVRKFIKECWSKCGCNKQCGNRVVQRGITCNLQVFQTPEEKGWGLRTLEDLPRGTFVCEYVGEILTNSELYERNIRSAGNERHTYPVLLDADWGSEGVLKDEEALCLDATHYGNVARFINHRCWDANLIEIPVEVETPDHHYYHIAFFTTRNIDAFEELTWDYGIDFEDHDHPIKAFHCCCGSEGCRYKKEAESTKSKAIVLC